MKKRWFVLGLVVVVGGGLITRVEAGSPVETAFTYQGQLKQGGVPVDGLFDFRFELLAQDGGALMARVCVFDVEVTHGLFTAAVDFGATAFDGVAVLLQVAVKLAIPSQIEACVPIVPDPFTPVGAPTPITAAPYCLHALSAANGHALDAADGSPTDAVFVDNNGNVGIGTTTPSRQLEVSSPGDTEIGVRSSDTDGRLWSLQSSGVSGAVTDATFQIVDRTAGASRMTIDTVGNVGVGTTAPEGRLHVRQGSAGIVTANANSTVVIEDGGISYLSLLTPDASESGILFGSPVNPANGGIVFNNTAALDGLQFRTGGSATRMVIDNVGRVGIGTTSPTRALEVAEPGAAEIGVRSTDADGRLWTLQSSGIAGTALDGTFQIIDRTAGASRLTITPGGQVGIGTTTPGGRLQVGGPGGDTSVILPGDSISAAETLEEPGLASRFLDNLVTLTPDGTITVLSRTITVPTDGFVIAYASASVEPGIIVGSAQPSLRIKKTTAPVAFTDGFGPELGSLEGAAISFHAVFAVSAGANAFEVTAISFGNDCNIITRRLTLLFVPTTYGTTDVED